MNEKLKNWCASATAQIRYKPDRAEVEAELMAHIEDKADALRAKGVPEEEINGEVLRSMGSAEAIAPQLAAIHKPWLGYIYRTAAVLTAITCLLAVFLWGTFGGNLLFKLIDTANFDSLIANHGQLKHYSHPNVSDSSDGYRFQVTEAGLDATGHVLYLELQVTYWPWMADTNATRYIWATDSKGNYYASQAEAAYQNIPRVSFGGEMSTGGISCLGLNILHFSDTANWVELHYDRDGRDIVLRIDLTGGDGA